jgi:hypothetical protein
MSRRLIVILVIGAIALIWGWLDGPAARQERGMKAAHARQLQLQPRLEADPRFSSVSLRVSTHPALFAHGTVSDEQALQDLKSIVVLPPDANYRLIFSVKVDEDAATRPAH